MKKFILLLISAAIPFLSDAQATFFVSPGTNLFIKPATILYAGGLTLVPTINYAISNVTLWRNAAVNYTSANPSINRAYYFDNIMPAFTGLVQVEYRTAELNGLNELLLRPNVHNGTTWQAYSSTINNVIDKYVTSAVFSTTALSEITLASVSAPLPIDWGNVTAVRNNQVNVITWTTNQEQNVDYFNIECSTDMKTWTVVISGIAANNKATRQQYHQTDLVYKPQYLLYRIAEKDIDGRLSYSASVPLQAVDQSSLINIYPNPAIDRFYISSPHASAVASVNLYSSTGVLVKHWSEDQAFYTVAALPPGVYIVSIKTKSGLLQNSRLVLR